MEAFPCVTLALRMNKVKANKWKALWTLLEKLISEKARDFLVVIKHPETSLERLLPRCGFHTLTHMIPCGLRWNAVGLNSAVIYLQAEEECCVSGEHCFSRPRTLLNKLKFFRAPKRSGTSALITIQGFEHPQGMNRLETVTPTLLMGQRIRNWQGQTFHLHYLAPSLLYSQRDGMGFSICWVPS